MIRMGIGTDERASAMDLGLEGNRVLVTGSTAAIGFAAAVVVRAIA